MDAQPQPIFDYYVLLPHRAEPRLLLCREDSRWTLPHFSRDVQHFWQTVDHINAAMREMFNVDTTVLRCIHTGKDPLTGHIARVYEVESHSPSWTPPEDARWTSHEELNGLDCIVPGHRFLLEMWFLEAAGAQISPLRPPWARRGWFEEALEWIDTRLASLGLERSGPAVQLRTWQRSCVLRVPVLSGDLYFKALPPMFAFEIPLLQLLAEKRPGNFPTFLAIDDTRHWMLMPDLGGTLLDKVPDITRWEEGLEEYARVQIDLAPSVNDLLAVGCPDRRLNWLAGEMDELLGDTDLLKAGHEWLSGDDIVELRSMAPDLKRMCEELTAFNIPYSIEHGDFWLGNVIATDSGYVYFDWSDSSVAHPFFSLVLIYQDEWIELPDVPDARQRLRDAYLRPWAAYEPVDRLRRAFDIAQTLAPVHNALFYRTLMLPNMEAKWEMENMPPYFLKLLLKRVG